MPPLDLVLMNIDNGSENPKRVAGYAPDGCGSGVMLDYRKCSLFRRNVSRGARTRKPRGLPPRSSVPYLRRKRRWNAAEVLKAQIGDAIASPEAPRSGSEALVALAAD